MDRKLVGKMVNLPLMKEERQLFGSGIHFRLLASFIHQIC